MIVLGLSGTGTEHDAAAALVVDGTILAAAEEERFIRRKHASYRLPEQAALFCLRSAGINPHAIQAVAIPWSTERYRELCRREAWRRLPDVGAAWKMSLRTRRINRGLQRATRALLDRIGIPESTPLVEVPHHLAHAASAYLLSGFSSAAILSLDGKGERDSTLLAIGEKGSISKIKEFFVPDSLGHFYSAITEYLGFEIFDGEYKVMGMAPYGDPSRISMEELIHIDREGFHVNSHLVWPRGRRRYPGTHFGYDLVKRWGPPRSNDDILEPYIHIAASAQKKLEEVVLSLVNTYLADPLRRCGGRLCLAGGVALNVKMNQQLLKHPLVKEIFVQPAANDAGTSLGAAVYVAHERGDRIHPMTSAYLGPEFTNDDIRKTLDGFHLSYRSSDSIVEDVADLLAQGKVVAWFQGRMEFGPRALGARSILAHPGIRGIADDVNARIKYREKWRPFCPSVLVDAAPDILGTDHPAPYMTLSFHVPPKWKQRIPEVVHVDGTARPQTVDRKTHPRYYALLKGFERRTGLPAVVNTSLNRRGEPIVCTPADALAMFYGSGLDYLAIGDFILEKRPTSREKQAGHGSSGEPMSVSEPISDSPVQNPPPAGNLRKTRWNL